MYYGHQWHMWSSVTRCNVYKPSITLFKILFCMLNMLHGWFVIQWMQQTPVSLRFISPDNSVFSTREFDLNEPIWLLWHDMYATLVRMYYLEHAQVFNITFGQTIHCSILLLTCWKSQDFQKFALAVNKAYITIEQKAYLLSLQYL